MLLVEACDGLRALEAGALPGGLENGVVAFGSSSDDEDEFSHCSSVFDIDANTLRRKGVEEGIHQENQPLWNSR